VAREAALNPSALDVGQSPGKITVDYTFLRGGALVGSGGAPGDNVDHAAGNAEFNAVSVLDASSAAQPNRFCR
jgi:hypothetical protein